MEKQAANLGFDEWAQFPYPQLLTGLVNGGVLTNVKARLQGSPRLINAVESTKVNRVNSSFQRKWSTGLTGEQVGDGQLSFNVVDSLWVTRHRLPVCVLFLYVWFYFW